MGRRNDRSSISESTRVGELFRAGDARAADQVRLRVRRTLSFRGHGIPGEDRRDLEQIVMTQLWQQVERPEFDPGAGFWGFVELVVARRCIDWRRARRHEIALDEAALEATALEAAGVDPHSEDSPLDSALVRERAALARAVVERLPDACRELIRLQIERGMTYAQAAEVLGAAEGALRVRMHRCVQRAQGILRRLEAEKKSPSEV